MAGTRPKTKAVATDSTTEKPRTRRSRLRILSCATSSPAPSRTSAGTATALTATPSAALPAATQRAFDEQLSHEAAAAGAERRAKGEVVFAAGQPREHQVGDVRAGDEQDEGDRSHQDRKRRPHVAGQHPREWDGGHRIG